MDDKVPKYLALKQQIGDWLQEGRYKADEQMLSENELAAMFGLSRQTVRQTIGELVNDGLLYRVQGKGTFVSRLRVRTAGDTPTIGMVTTYISDYIFPHIVRGAESELSRRGCGLLLSSTDNDKLKERDSLERMLSYPASGLIIEPTKSAQGNANMDLYIRLELEGIPFVMINERYSGLDCPCIRVDDEAGGYEAASHLISLGHRELAGFFKTDDIQGTMRMKGFMRACREKGIPLHPERLVLYSSEDKHEKPLEAASRLLTGDRRPTALVCYNDELAVRLVDAAAGLGLSVPGDLSLTGFDDSAYAVAGPVKLTSLTHPKAELGIKAAETLLGLIEGRPGEAKEFVYKPELVIRDSTAALEK
ncbi:GntR family transcriptional regulator [Paenibacillus sp. D9]|uniref:GntR family transcriptional regulator n=1 Tax=Paenibacillus TaxID=44249 RepID=UPI00061F6AC7|nr:MULTISPECIES: GntR family transcriptional regulator [Paenibacillus]KKC47182.1 GntR family transcriptional regulator [Paenibacillus sp. D9]